MVGYSQSGISGDKTQTSQGSSDYWVIKIDANGNKLWDKTFGGSAHDYVQDAIVTEDQGYLLYGYSSSGQTGDKSEISRGSYDYWIVKIDANGNKLWDKSFGGLQPDYAASVTSTSEGGFLLLGESDSEVSGEKSQASKGSRDYWVVKIDANGNKIWDKVYGGIGDESAAKLVKAFGGGFILAGHSDSGITGDKSEISRGSADYWVVKIDADGNL